MSIRRYDGPPINLPVVRAHIELYQERNNGLGPTEDELVRSIRRKYYRAVPKSYHRERVKSAIEIGKKLRLIEERNEGGVIRYYPIGDF